MVRWLHWWLLLASPVVALRFMLAEFSYSSGHAKILSKFQRLLMTFRCVPFAWYLCWLIQQLSGELSLT